MAVYEYQCPKCGEKFEVHRNIFSTRGDVKCPKCGADTPQRVYSPFSTGCSTESCPPAPRRFG